MRSIDSARRRRFFGASGLHALLIGAILTVTGWSARSFAQVPRTLTYQGFLTDDVGAPVPDGAYELQFSLYDVATGGAAIHTETHPGVTTESGHFTVELGRLVPFTIGFDASYWLGIQVAGGPEIVPRVRLTAAPYALGLALPLSLHRDGPEPVFHVENHDPDGTALTAGPWFGIEEGGSPAVRGFVLGYGQGLSASRYAQWGVGRGGAGGLPRAGIAAFTRRAELSVTQTGSTPLWASLEYGGGVSPYDPVLTLPRPSGSNTIIGPFQIVVPEDYITSSAILDEPGASSAARGIFEITLPTTLTTILSTTLDCPTAGYVMVFGTCEGIADHTSGTASQGVFGISTSATSLPSNQDMDLALPSSLGSGRVKVPVGVERIFPVTSGMNTFHFLGRTVTGSYSADDIQLTAIFLPTAYGTIYTGSAPPAGSGDAMATDDEASTDPDAVRAASVAANEARIAREQHQAQTKADAARARMKRVLAEFRHVAPKGGSR